MIYSRIKFKNKLYPPTDELEDDIRFAILDIQIQMILSKKKKNIFAYFVLEINGKEIMMSVDWRIYRDSSTVMT